MPDVSVHVTLTHKKYTKQPVAFSATVGLTQEDEGVSKTVVNAGTDWTALVSGVDIASIVCIRNLNATNYVEVATVTNDDVKVPFAKIMPRGLPLVLPVNNNANYVYRANTAACDLSLFAVEA